VSAITTHVLDIAAGCPAAGLAVRLEHVAPAGPQEIARATTDSGGRITSLGPERIEPGTYRLVFDTGGYHGRQAGSGASASSRTGDSNASGTDEPVFLPAVPFFPEVTITFTVADDREHYHVPLLMSPFGYSTYRGS
jgi:5-hydroxyisourate hydrolase